MMYYVFYVMCLCITLIFFVWFIYRILFVACKDNVSLRLATLHVTIETSVYMIIAYFVFDSLKGFF